MAKKKKKTKPKPSEPVASAQRCTGHCCKHFYLPYGPEEMKAEYRRWLVLNGEHRRSGIEALSMGPPEGLRGGAKESTIIDIHLIYPMLIYLGRFRDQLPYKPVRPPESLGEGVHIYTCKHLDRKTGDCTIYEIRPQMCREYPYSGLCNYAGCTWEERKVKPLPKPPKERSARLKVLEDDLTKLGNGEMKAIEVKHG